MSNRPKIGPTGKFPRGKLNAQDDGEINILVHHTQTHVVLEFNSPVKWTAFDPDYADHVADVLKKHAAEVRAEQAKKDANSPH